MAISRETKDRLIEHITGVIERVSEDFEGGIQMTYNTADPIFLHTRYSVQPVEWEGRTKWLEEKAKEGDPHIRTPYPSQDHPTFGT